MFVNKLNQLYKPDRLLYYIDASEDDLARFAQGIIPDEIGKYAGSFGVYDYPGVFLIKTMARPVIGIEFRIGDDRISYPEALASIRLAGSYYCSIEMDDEIAIDRDIITDLFVRTAGGSVAQRLYSDLSIRESSDVIAVFAYSKKMRILYESSLNDEIAGDVISGEPDRFDKPQLFEMAFTDPLTKHYNWNHLVAFLELPAQSDIRDYAFVHFDIKEFRVINEVYGHNTGNKVLCNVSKAINEADFVYASARCHNDNFAMMIKDMPEEETVRVLGEFFEKLSYLDEDPSYRIYFRCGVVPMQRTILSGNRVADAGKMAQALGVSQKKTDITIYTDRMHDDITWGDFIKAYVGTAIANDEFHVYLQPKFDSGKEAISGSEALIRWNYKGKELLSPGRFIPFFEKDGTIGKIDDIVLEKVCKALVKWKSEGKPLYPVSVNLSRKRLYDPDIIEHLTGIVDRYGISHELIDFELTESAAYDDKEHMIRVLESLRERGFKISMDDFGTGYSSLSLLTEMPLGTLKIDKSFVDKLGTGNDREQDLIVIRHIITLAKELGFKCLAEGAERKEQVDVLRALGCNVIQGYYYSKPVPVEEFEGKYLS